MICSGILMLLYKDNVRPCLVTRQVPILCSLHCGVNIEYLILQQVYSLRGDFSKEINSPNYSYPTCNMFLTLSIQKCVFVEQGSYVCLNKGCWSSFSYFWLYSHLKLAASTMNTSTLRSNSCTCLWITRSHTVHRWRLNTCYSMDNYRLICSLLGTFILLLAIGPEENRGF